VTFFDVHESGRPGAPTVLLSSGLGGTAGYWAPQLAALTAHCRVITYDQAGTSRNKRDLPDDHSIGAMGDEILAVLDATKTGRAHIVGHALGGLAGLDVAIRHPERLYSLTVVNGRAVGTGGDCLATVWLDGVQIAGGSQPVYDRIGRRMVASQELTEVDAYLLPGEIAGVEVYARGIMAPPQFLPPGDPNATRCAIVAFWTKHAR